MLCKVDVNDSEKSRTLMNLSLILDMRLALALWTFPHFFPCVYFSAFKEENVLEGPRAVNDFFPLSVLCLKLSTGAIPAGAFSIYMFNFPDAKTHFS